MGMLPLESHNSSSDRFPSKPAGEINIFFSKMGMTF